MNTLKIDKLILVFQRNIDSLNKMIGKDDPSSFAIEEILSIGIAQSERRQLERAIEILQLMKEES